MTDQRTLFRVLRRFARTTAGDYDVIDVLYELCDHTIEALDADGAGVSLYGDDGVLRFVTASDEGIVTIEKTQEVHQAGPCYRAIQDHHPIAVTDIREHDDWPDYRTTAEHLGLLAVLGLPLMIGDEDVGALNVYVGEPRRWAEADIDAGSVLGDIAAAYVRNAGRLADSRRTAEQLQHALDSRIVIEQAKGRLAGEMAVSVDEAFARLRQHARSRQRSLANVAAAVVERGVSAL